MQTFENSILGPLYHVFTRAADLLGTQDRITFSILAGLPTDRWDRDHREMYALARIHYMYEVKRSGVSVHPLFLEAAKILPRCKLPPLPFNITNELRDIILRQMTLSSE